MGDPHDRYHGTTMLKKPYKKKRPKKLDPNTIFIKPKMKKTKKK